jgi:hypothetical protein
MVSFQQTDAAAPLGPLQVCSALALSAAPGSWALVEEGIAGSTPFVASWTNNSNASWFCFEIDPQVDTGVFPAGDYVMRLNVTSAAASAGTLWRRFYVCRVTAAGTNVATLASATSQTTALNSTGVKTNTVTQAADSLGNNTDRVFIVLAIQANATDTVTITPDQMVDTPLPQRPHTGYLGPMAMNVLGARLRV